MSMVRGPARAAAVIVALLCGAAALAKFVSYTHLYTGTSFNPASLQTDVPGYYYLDWRGDILGLGPLSAHQDADGVLTVGDGVEHAGRVRRDPLVVIQLCLGLHDLLLDSPNEEYDAVLRRQVDWLLGEAMVVMPGDVPVWPQFYRHERYGLEAPWMSALTQGQAVSLLVRMASYTGDREYAEWARRAARAFTRRGFPIVWRGDDGGVYFEEYPCDPPSHVLNGCLFAWLGLWDLVRYSGDAELRRFCLDSLEHIEARVPTYEWGDWTRYSVFHQRPTSPVYQEIHASLAETLHQLTGDPFWGERASRWRAAAADPMRRTGVFFEVLIGKIEEAVRGRRSVRGLGLAEVDAAAGAFDPGADPGPHDR